MSAGVTRAETVTRLLYVSTSTAGVSSGLAMSDILSDARPANSRDGITGVLTVVGGRFIQLIEGTDVALDGLMTRLLKDHRHTDLTVLTRERNVARQFGDWDMVSPRLAAPELSVLALLLDDPAATIEDYASVLARAVSQQEGVLEGRHSPEPAGDLAQPMASALARNATAP